MLIKYGANVGDKMNLYTCKMNRMSSKYLENVFLLFFSCSLAHNKKQSRAKVFFWFAEWENPAEYLTLNAFSFLQWRNTVQQRGTFTR